MIAMLIAFFKDNQSVIGEGTAGLVAACSAFNRLLPANKGPAWLHSMLDRISALAKPGMNGTVGPVTIPIFTKSKKKKLPDLEKVIEDAKK